MLRARFDKWLAGKVREAIDASDFAEESFIATDIKVDQVLMEGGRAIGIKTGDEEFHARVVIIAEGEQFTDAASGFTNRLCACRSYAHGH